MSKHFRHNKNNAMQITVDIPEDQAVRFEKQASARGLTLDRWLLELADQNAPERSSRQALAEVFARARGLGDDLDINRDPSPGREVIFD